MDAGLILGGALLLLLCIVVLQIFWRLLLILFVLGPPTLIAMSVGRFAGIHSGNALVGFVAAICVVGALNEIIRFAFRKWRTL